MASMVEARYFWLSASPASSDGPCVIIIYFPNSAENKDLFLNFGDVYLQPSIVLSFRLLVVTHVIYSSALRI